MSSLFFFNDTATTEIYTLSLHDALPIYRDALHQARSADAEHRRRCRRSPPDPEGYLAAARALGRAAGHCGVLRCASSRSEEHTSELQSRQYLVCRLLLEKKNNKLSRNST